MTTDPNVIASALLSLLVLGQGAAVRYSGRARSLARRLRECQAMTEDLMESLHAHRVLMIDAGLPLPPYPRRVRAWLDTQDR